MKELWKPVPEFEEHYSVSNLGRVRRVGRRFIKPRPNNRGYLVIDFHVNGRAKTRLLHRTVAIAFLPNPKSLPEVNHLGSKGDCRAHKLEWRSPLGHKQQHMRDSQAGVNFDKSRGKWLARYSPQSKRSVYIGRFNTKKEAMQARKAAVATIPYVV